MGTIKIYLDTIKSYLMATIKSYLGATIKSNLVATMQSYLVAAAMTTLVLFIPFSQMAGFVLTNLLILSLSHNLLHSSHNWRGMDMS